MTDHKPLYSVIVPAYQAATSIGLCLDALNAQTVPGESYEVIVVDDGSTDGTDEIAQRAGVQVIIQRNAGAAAAVNAGACSVRVVTFCYSRTPIARLCRAGSPR